MKIKRKIILDPYFISGALISIAFISIVATYAYRISAHWFKNSIDESVGMYSCFQKRSGENKVIFNYNYFCSDLTTDYISINAEPKCFSYTLHPTLVSGSLDFVHTETAMILFYKGNKLIKCVFDNLTISDDQSNWAYINTKYTRNNDLNYEIIKHLKYVGYIRIIAPTAQYGEVFIVTIPKNRRLPLPKTKFIE